MTHTLLRHRLLRHRVLRHLLPWVVTAAAVAFVVRGIEWSLFFGHLREASVVDLALAAAFTGFSYLLRARRWQSLFPTRCISFADSARVLVLGFFMNNVLPARTGELVRAHLGSKVSKSPRTLVLATVAAERLADGLMLSLLFVAFAPEVRDHGSSRGLTYVSWAFGAAAAGVVTLLVVRRRFFSLASAAVERYGARRSTYLLERARQFVDGLAPLTAFPGCLVIAGWTAVIWSVELLVFSEVSRAFDHPLPLPLCVLFMVVVNFSSLIPAAPGGIGVIEAAATTVLVSTGVDRERALTMVLSQHVIQYLMVGVPGVFYLLTSRGTMKSARAGMHEADGHVAAGPDGAGSGGTGR